MFESFQDRSLLSVRHLTKRYSDFTLNDVSFDVPAGTVVGIVGVNGAGKTTLLKSILGIVIPDSGSIALFGEETIHTPEQRFAELKQRIGTVFDTIPYPSFLTARDIGELMHVAYVSWDQTTYQTYLRQFDLPEERKIKEYSRGMGMKLQLAVALSHQADLLILDEATAGLDPLARAEVLDVLRDILTEDRSIVMSSHITSDFEHIADYIICIDNGAIAFAEEAGTITDMAGIAHCRTSDIDAIKTSGLFEPQTLYALRTPTEVTVLVPDRFVFARAFPSIVLENARIDDYVTLTLKGERL